MTLTPHPLLLPRSEKSRAIATYGLDRSSAPVHGGGVCTKSMETSTLLSNVGTLLTSNTALSRGKKSYCVSGKTLIDNEGKMGRNESNPLNFLSDKVFQSVKFSYRSAERTSQKTQSLKNGVNSAYNVQYNYRRFVHREPN